MNIGGKKISNWWLLAGGGGVILLVVLYKRSTASSPAASTGGGTGTDTAGTDTSAGYASGYTGSSGAYGGGGYGGTAGYPTVNAGTPGTSAGGTYSTNAAWAQAVTAGLVGIGYDAQTVASAIGLFLAGSPLSATQAQIIQVAEAEFGPPPQGTYSIIPEPSGGGTGPGSGGGGTGGGGGPITAVPGNFRVTHISGLSISLAWDPVQVPQGQGPLAGYTVAYGQSPGNTPYELAVGPGTTSATITFNSGPGAHGLTHYFEVWARPAAPGGPHAGPISGTTQ